MFSLILRDEERVYREHCCPEMTAQVNTTSILGASPMEGSTDQRIYWSAVFNEYGLLCQPSPEILRISHCPFCGVRLPASDRDAWFAALERLGWSTWGDPIPAFMLKSGWRAAQQAVQRDGPASGGSAR
jgi:hypothetical protein